MSFFYILDFKPLLSTSFAYVFSQSVGCVFILFMVSFAVQNLIRLNSFHFELFAVVQFSLVQFSRSVMSDSLQPHELQYVRPPCSSPTPGVHSNSCTLSQWCHPAIWSSVVPFFSCPQSLPASASFPMSQVFAWSGQRIGVSALASFLPKNTKEFLPKKEIRANLLQNGLVGCPCSPRDSQESSPTPQLKSINYSALSFLHCSTFTSVHDHGKNHSLD